MLTFELNTVLAKFKRVQILVIFFIKHMHTKSDFFSCINCNY